MPIRRRSRLLALALTVGCFACAAIVVLVLFGDVTNARAGVSIPAPVSRPTPTRHVALHVRTKSTLGERAAHIALKAVGVPYHWGGSSPTSGFDCSGLISWAYGRLGVDLPHSSYTLSGKGRRVKRSRLRPGDLLFFYGFGHVGMYIGHGRMVHAAHSGTLVQVVKLSRSGYGSALISARRLTHA
ncbi:MAG: C40 family peptidase [Actinomycetota bacterium]